MARVHLSKADVGPLEEEYLLDALHSGWVAPLGPHVDRFEAEVAARVGVSGAVALSSGTAALHLALLGCGAGPGSVVMCPTLTFAATANAITYTGAEAVFVDARAEDGNVDPELLIDGLDRLLREGHRVAAVVTVDLFGRCADYGVIEAALTTRGIPLVEDAAESLGACWNARPAGSFGKAAILSFNGNKVMTTSGGGMLLSDDQALVDRARYLATQARQPVPWYEHTEVGYNYRLSNLLAAVGRAQLSRLDTMIERRRHIRRRYHESLSPIPGVRLLGDAQPGSLHEDNCWLSTIELDPSAIRCSAAELISKLDDDDIEARPLWKPMHLQPSFAGCRFFGNGASERLFVHGVALPSGSALTDDDIDRVLGSIHDLLSVSV